MISRRTFPLLILFLALPLLLLAYSPASTTRPAAAAEIPGDNTVTHDEHDHTRAPHATIPIEFSVIIERVTATNNFDGPFGWDRADFFARVRIDTQVYESPVWSNQDDIRPNWSFVNTVMLDPAVDPASITIEIWDSDDRGNRQRAALNGDGDRALVLDIDPLACLTAGTAGAIGGDATGACGQTVFTSGVAGENTADLRFRIEANEPAINDDLLVRCLHSPIWPQPGDIVEVYAESLDNALNARTADDIEIWFGATGDATAVCSGDDDCITETTVGGSISSLFYGCRVTDDGVSVWSGWKRFQVGPPSGGSAVPVVFTGSSNSRVDIVFVPDDNDYASELDPAFLDGVHDVIRDAYYGTARRRSGPDSDYGERLYLANQQKLNFWIATDKGQANGFPNRPCVQPPANWNEDYTFAEVGAILHTRNLRDCARRGDRIFSTEPTSVRTVLHETSHAPFGLADEYCCDSSYSEPSPNPNIYGNLGNCEADLLNLQAWDVILGDPLRTNCRQIADGSGNTIDFFTSEPSSDDLMNDSGEYNGADVRRMEWGLEQCATPRCDGALGGSPEAPVPGFDTGGQKLITVDVFFGRRDAVILAEDAISVRYGMPRAHFGAPPLLRIDLFDTGGQLVGQYHEWHPLLESGTFDQDPNMNLPEHGPAVWLKEGAGTFVVPFTPALETMQITDVELGQTLLTVDLLPAMEAFCATHADDADCDLVGLRTYTNHLPIAIRQ